jgi:transposase
MPKQRMDLRMIKDIIRLRCQTQLSHEQIATTLKVSKGVVSKYLSLAKAVGLDWEAAQSLDERQLTLRLLPRANTAGKYIEPDWAAIHRELDRKGVTLVLLWQEYQAANPEGRTWGYTQFWAHYKSFVQRLKRSMRQHRLAGEKLFIDFAGPSVPLLDGGRAQVFVAAMAASSCVFACARPTQRLEDWVEGIVRALAFYGGVPQLIVPDNARALIAEADRYEPRANATVQDLCRHYGTSVLPARPRSPKDKAAAESSVQVITRWVLARLRHRQFSTVGEVDAAIAALLPSVNERPFQKLAGSRASVFAELDAPALAPLPAQPYELARFKTVKVHIDYHVEIEAHRYSVPHALVGQTLQARLTRACIELLLRGTRVASHARSERRGGYTTVDEHMPAAHRAHKEWTPERLIQWGRQVGMSTGELITRQLHLYKHPEHAYRSCLGLLSLSKRYGTTRLEAACERALALGTFKYRHVRDLLANNRDHMPSPDHPDWVSPEHANLRGAGYYQ